MASDTAPSAVPDPADPPTSTAPSGPAAGPITSLLTPVQPARPTSAAFNLDPANATPDSLDTPAEAQTAGVSSAAYQNDANTPQSGGKNGTGNGQQTGVMRAFALAAIERWKKGADARNKRLDIQKAKAQAHQVKEARTVNRAEKIVGGSTNSGTTSGKSLDSKGQKNAGNSGTTKNGKTNSGSGSSGRSGGGGGSGSGGSSGGRGTSGGSSGAKNGSGGGRGPGGSSGHGAGGNSPKTSKTDAKGHHESSKGADGRKSGGRSGSGTMKETATCGDSSGISLSKDKKSRTRGTSSDTGKGGRVDSPAKGGSKDSSSGTTEKGKGGASPKPSSAGDTKTGTGPKKADLEKKDTKTGKDGKPKDTTTAKAATTQPATKGQPIHTKPSREAGYRDGSRTAQATAHVKAYRDGFRDGHRDTSEAAQREKERLDQAHEARKQQRAKDQPVTASSADHQPQGPQPIDVKEVTDKHVTLDGGQTFTRGEVRNLKQYERRMGEKATNMNKAAEGTRQLQAHAEEQADKALKFLEMAKTVEGGDRFVGVLTRLHESATIQIREAQELHKRVVRAAENTRIVLINVEIRYGGIYKAVCDSPLTKPAELNWYRK